MKKTSFFLLLVLTMLVGTAQIYAQASWVTKKIDNRLSVKFPGEPQKTIRNGVDSYIFKGNDSISYSSTLIDYKVLAHLDSATLAPIKDSQGFVDRMKEGIVAQKANYTFGDIIIGTWKNYTTYNITGADNTNKKKLLIHMILIGSKMYMLSYLVPDGLVTKNNEMFFGSAELSKI
ncbi:hypothetical protein [Pedobacter gandavensis]|uniref:DUF4252 domain-containing protein n=1 Tax=Pedobacter gandavensis TaxID=2679963 RepID=A0ABR6ETH5_9SPHI|nr:hypothetical protein [Pedobacter gandavensis]MBB2148577.1 hypothetical protein [Pedobacter gandavensis]